MKKKDIRLQAIGDLSKLPVSSRAELEKAMAETAENKGLTLVLALSYSGKWDLVQATQQISAKVKTGELAADSIHADTIQAHLSTAEMPDPDLMIRTGGDHRISNFMLWQLAMQSYIFLKIYFGLILEKNIYMKRLSIFKCVKEGLGRLVNS